MRKIALFIFIFFVIQAKVYSQENNQEAFLKSIVGKIIPPSPEAAAFARYGEFPIDYSSGVPKIEIPLYTIKIGDFELPITLSYHASGNRVNDISTSVGLGWVVNTGGVISRTVNGGEDAGDKDYVFKNAGEVGRAIYDKSKDYKHFWKRVLDGTDPDKCTESDRYSYNFNGKSGIFRYNIANKDIITLPYSPIKIDCKGTFKITDTDGTMYFFEESEFTGCCTRTSWYVSRIVTANKIDTIDFKYKFGGGGYLYLPSQYNENGWEYEIAYEDAYVGAILGLRRVNRGIITWDAQFNTCRVIESIQWRGNSIEFLYSKDRFDGPRHEYTKELSGRDRLNKMIVRNINKEVVRMVEFHNQSYFGSRLENYRMKLSGIDISGSLDSNNKNSYHFDYNKMDLPNYYKRGDYSFPEDYWGFYNGKLNNQSLIPNDDPIYKVDRNPSEDHMKACILEKITYPTGGSTSFDFKPNKKDDNFTILGGSLCIKNITNRDTDGTILNIKNYTYDEMIETIPITNDLYSYTQTFRYCYQTRVDSDYEDRVLDRQVVISSPLVPLSGLSGRVWAYTKVTEYNGALNSPNGKTEYYYEEDRDDLCECDGGTYDDYRFYSSLYNCDQGIVPLLLTSKIDYSYSDGKYQIKREEKNEYTLFDKSYVRIGVRVKPTEIPVFLNYVDEENLTKEHIQSLNFYDVFGFQSLRMLTSKTIKDFENRITTESTYEYDEQLRTMSPLKTSNNTSNGEKYVTENKYPFHIMDNICTQMVAANLVDPVIESREYRKDNLLRTYINQYKEVNGKFFLEKIGLGNKDIIENRVVFGNYDIKGNLNSYIKDGNDKVVYLWSYNGQYPIAEIKGVTIDQIKSYGIDFDALSKKSTPTTSDWETIDKIRQNVSLNAFVTTYTYQPLVGMTSMTNPGGITTYYEYDSFGRLKYVRDNDKNVLNRYIYNYHNSNDFDKEPFNPSLNISFSSSESTFNVKRGYLDPKLTNYTFKVNRTGGQNPNYTYKWTLTDSDNRVVAQQESWSTDFTVNLTNVGRGRMILRCEASEPVYQESAVISKAIDISYPVIFENIKWQKSGSTTVITADIITTKDRTLKFKKRGESASILRILGNNLTFGTPEDDGYVGLCTSAEIEVTKGVTKIEWYVDGENYNNPGRLYLAGSYEDLDQIYLGNGQFEWIGGYIETPNF